MFVGGNGRYVQGTMQDLTHFPTNAERSFYTCGPDGCGVDALRRVKNTNVITQTVFNGWEL